MEQWVSSVRSFSSQYNDGTWAAHQVIGPPKVYPRYGDINGAWAQSGPDANEYLEVTCFSFVFHFLINLFQFPLFFGYDLNSLLSMENFAFCDRYLI